MKYYYKMPQTNPPECVKSKDSNETMIIIIASVIGRIVHKLVMMLKVLVGVLVVVGCKRESVRNVTLDRSRFV